MSDFSRFHYSVILLFGVFSVLLLFTGYFKIGLVSDDYLNFYDATHSTFQDKLTGKLPYTNSQHIRPVYYLSLEKSLAISKWLGLEYDNFVFYRIQNLFLLMLISFIAGRVILYFTGRWSIALVAAATVILFPNNLNNICWTAARVDLLCGLFYVTILYYTIRYIVFADKFSLLIIFASFILALFTKETSLTIPFVMTLFIYFVYGFKVIVKYKFLFISMFAVLILFLIYRFVFIGNNFGEISTLYQENPFSNAPGVLARSVIGLTIPLDFLTLSRMLRQDNKIVILYLAALYGGGAYLIWVILKVDEYKHIGQLLLLGLILISPYLVVGYIRPQMVFIPFVILMIFTFWVYDHHRQFNVSVNKLLLKAFYSAVMIFWLIWSYSVIEDWSVSYAKARENIDNLISTGLDQKRQNIVIGSPGRYRQAFLFDNLTGAYNYWREKGFTIKDTINDVIQTGTVEESSISAPLEMKTISHNEFEIKTTGKSQFFYIEGYDYDKIRTGFTNKDISVTFTEFNYLEKPIKLNLTILSENVSCYLASGLKFTKIY